MRKRFFVVLAAVGWIVLTGTDHANEKAEHEQTQAQQAIANDLDNLSTAYALDRAEKAQAPKETGPCGERQYGGNADLCAQWKAADAASDSAWWAWVSGTLSFISLAGVVGALGLTYWANRIASGTARRQLRAYVHVERVWVDFPNNGAPRITVRCKNTGQTPAKFFEVAAIVRMMSVKDDERSRVPKFARFKRWTVLGSGSSRTAQIVPENPEKMLMATLAASHAGKAFFVQGTVRYQDILGELWETEFTAFATSDSRECRQGRRMTFANSDVRAFEKVSWREQGSKNQKHEFLTPLP